MPPPIIIVDDEESILFAMQDYFIALGYHVDCARELDEAKGLLALTSYAVAIVDLRLTGSPGTEGLALLDYIRHHHPATQVIILTAYGLPETEQDARRRGAEAFLRKHMSLPEVTQWWPHWSEVLHEGRLGAARALVWPRRRERSI